jgi:hypothetical protein
MPARQSFVAHRFSACRPEQVLLAGVILIPE